jgi:NAD-dependent oxidoreductase involved in siderophore biosynthesis
MHGSPRAGFTDQPFDAETASVHYVPQSKAARHSTLSALAPTVGLLEAQTLSGHADVNVPLRHYVNADARAKQVALATLATAQSWQRVENGRS